MSSDLVEKVAKAIAVASANIAAYPTTSQQQEYAERNHADYETEARAAIKAVAEWLKPETERPCDCTVCYCGNVGDTEQVAYWDADNWRYVELIKQLWKADEQ